MIFCCFLCDLIVKLFAPNLFWLFLISVMLMEMATVHSIIAIFQTCHVYIVYSITECLSHTDAWD